MIFTQNEIQEVSDIESALERDVKKKSKFSIKAILYIVLAIAVMFDLVYLYLNHGHAGVIRNARTSEPIIEQSQSDLEAEVLSTPKWQTEWKMHNGQAYAYKEGLMSFLVTCTDGGFSDNLESAAFMLFSLDTKNKHIDYIPIDRHSIITSEDGKYGTLVELAAAAPRDERGDKQIELVSKLMHQLPIHGYVSVTMEGILPICEALDGVDVLALHDFDYNGKSVLDGDIIHLEGREIIDFLGEGDDELTADEKMDRKEMILNAIIAKVYAKVKTEPISFMAILNAGGDYVDTNMSTNQLMYLATEAAGFDLDNKSSHVIKGTSIVSNGRQEFHTDDEKLKDMIYETFYEKVQVAVD